MSSTFTYIIKCKVDGAPYYGGEFSWSPDRSGAKRYDTLLDANKDLLQLRQRSVPSKIYRVGFGLGVRISKEEYSAYRKVAAEAWRYVKAPQGMTTWSLRMYLNNALVTLDNTLKKKAPQNG